MSKDSSFSHGNNEHGFALFAVLSFLLLAAAIAAPLVTTARSSALIARNVAADLKDRVLADSLFLLAGAELTRRTRQADFELPRSVLCLFGQTSIRFNIQNHAGLIDLNAASPDLLRVGFLASGFGPDVVQKIAQTVVLYRSVEQKSGSGVPVTVTGGLKHGLFETVDELNDFQITGSDRSPAYRNIFTTRTATGTILNSAVPENTETVLKTLPPESAYFVVTGSPPHVALTLSVSVSRQGKRLLFASAELGPNATAEFLRLSPLTVAFDQGQQELPRTTFPVSDCRALFGQKTQEIIHTLFEGETR